MNLRERFFGSQADAELEDDAARDRAIARLAEEAEFVRCRYMPTFEDWIQQEIDAHDGPGGLEAMNFDAGYRAFGKTLKAKIKHLREQTREVD